MKDKGMFAGLTRTEFLKLPIEKRNKRLAEQAKQFNKDNPNYYLEHPLKESGLYYPCVFQIELETLKRGQSLREKK